MRLENWELAAAILDVLAGGQCSTSEVMRRLADDKGLTRHRATVWESLRIMERKGAVVSTARGRMRLWTATSPGNIPPVRETRKTMVLEILAEHPATSKEIAAAIEKRTGRRQYPNDVSDTCRALEKKGKIAREMVQCRHHGNHTQNLWRLRE